MKGFNRKRLISSLAASAMVATATLAPLPGLLATVHAIPVDSVFINNPASTDLTNVQGRNGLTIPLTYNCAAAGATGIQVTVTGNPGTGSTGTYTTGFPLEGLTCDSLTHDFTATIYPDTGTTFQAGTATIAVQLRNSTGDVAVGAARTATVRVI